jgi:hypothetical protein
MMFLMLFGSLAAAMAVVAQGNMRTADSGLKVSRAMSAAETGLVFAAQRLEAETRRFVVEKGVIDEAFAGRLWMGGPFTPSDGDITVLPPVGYPPQGPTPSGIAQAVRDAHLADQHSFIADPGDSVFPSIDADYGTLRVRPIALSALPGGQPNPNGPYFRLRYEPLVNGHVRVVSQGVEQGIIRTLQMEFAIVKRIEFAIISPNRIMIGKNVLIDGPLGSRYGIEPGELNSAHGHPLVMRSDFYHLDPQLDAKLDLFFDRVAQYDVDGDGRLRVNHPLESQGLAGTGLADHTGDGYVDDWDIFLAHFDANGDGMVVYDAALACAAGMCGLSVEFDVDLQLARLIDRARPDRDHDGVFTPSDTMLGYNDGVLDARDEYAKVRGRLAFAVSRSAWEGAHGEPYQANAVHGPIRRGLEQPAVLFEVSSGDMIEITTAMVSDSQGWFDNHSQSGAPFELQVTGQGGTHPSSVTVWEEVPWGSFGAYDWYQRPIYQNLTFTNVRIPAGTNALFVDCTFVGVTFIETESDCTHANWNFSGQRTRVDDGEGGFAYPLTELGERLISYHPEHGDIADTKPYSNNIRFHNCTFLGSVSGIVPGQYTHWRNKVQMTGQTRFYIDPNDAELLAQPDAAELQALLLSIQPAYREEMEKSSILMPGWSMDVGSFTSDPEVPPQDVARITLKGLIIAGIMDIRGNADVHGTLMMTFRPRVGEGPLAYAPPDCFSCLTAFVTEIGYFGPEDGAFEGIGPDHHDFDGFGEIALRYNPHAKLPDGIPWPLLAEPLPDTYLEGGQ